MEILIILLIIGVFLFFTFIWIFRRLLNYILITRYNLYASLPWLIGSKYGRYNFDKVTLVKVGTLKKHIDLNKFDNYLTFIWVLLQFAALLLSIIVIILFAAVILRLLV